jgi:hypothetical protein
MPTLEEARLYLGIDYADGVTDKNITRCLNTAAQTLYGAVGEDVETYLQDDSRITELQLIYMEDLYSQRGLTPKVSGATRRMVFDMEQQLRLELRTAKEEAGDA